MHHIFTASTLSPWEKREYTWYAPTTTSYRTWMLREITYELPRSDACEWLGDWMLAAKPGDVVYLDGDHKSCPEDHADVSITCDPV